MSPPFKTKGLCFMGLGLHTYICIYIFGNNEADRWAKAAACGDRVPREVRNRFASLSVRVTKAARWIGQVTAVAQHFLLDGGESCRDSAPSRARRKGQEPVAKRPRLAVQLRSAEDGGHLLEARGKGWWCISCRKSSGSWSILAPQRCMGPAPSEWHSQAKAHGHTLRVTGLVIWCIRCGQYAESCAKGLLHRCHGQPRHADAKARRALLAVGRHPVTGEQLVESHALGREHPELPQGSQRAAPTASSCTVGETVSQLQLSPAQQRLAALRRRVLDRIRGDAAGLPGPQG